MKTPPYDKKKNKKRNRKHPSKKKRRIIQSSRTTKEKKERKSLALLPSVYENVAKIAYVDRTSVSEIVSTLLEKYIEENQLKLLEHDRIKK